VQRAIQHAAQHPGYGYAVLFMDFDRFKQVNDTLGHAAGDQMLRQIAVRIEETLRPGDAVARVPSHLRTAARIGGDEFVVVLEGMRGVDDAIIVAERLLAVLSEPYRLGAHAVQSSASIGIVTADHAAASADEVLRDADTAMYEAKRAGRGRCVVFDSSMHERVVEALAFETELRRAVREGELFVVYQPVVDLDSGALVGAEALVRWRHPTQGVVTPAHFIGLAEETGLIDAIGGQVLESACAQFVRWRAELGARAPVELAVNLSRAQLERPELAAEVSAVLERCGMRAAELQFEITESLAAQSERVQAALRELKTLGVRLALDDFGTGYSSLACLHQLPVDTVKIDRSFVRHAETVEYHRVLIEATIRVARALRMTTVAEGIETTGEATLMEQLHCDRGQGYLFGKPMAADEFARWVLATADA
jgi:diguanylate cyclase (GGDEF)-like protein